MTEHFGNAASRNHPFGWEAEEAVDYAREQVAKLIGADPKEIIFTSGATEADNLGIKGIFEMYASKGNHIITVKTEHKAVLNTCEYLENKGFEVTYLDEDGLGSGTNDVVTRNTGWFLFPVDFVKTQMKIYPQFNPRRLMDRANFKTVAESKKLGDDVGKNIFSFLGGKRRVSTLRQTKTNKRNKCKGKSKGNSTKVKMSGGSKKKVKNNRKTRKLKT